ncbi:UDP-N-acetylmuramoyl-L-alanine--D-glutamate ligase (plasmid) [Streptosporangium sp. CA-135522]|uniref:UDP-N-acetylmuramoyl-L-alanine--D-glutamate ligase n=1 Tax=Streptosporangium sp. CA-135522 TaxID=3240072 RepID=UPI003D905ABE
MFLNHARILIIGLGISGEAAAALCAARGSAVTVTDTRGTDQLRPALERLADLPISYHLGAEPPPCGGFTLIIRSPGIPRDLPVLTAARRDGIPVWSEIELASAVCPCPSIAITGTNGKSTTTILVGQLMRAAGRSTHVVGNIGAPFASAVAAIDAGDVAVVEVSSAQLEDCHAFAPTTAVLTNLRPEHMDHYVWQDYVAAKARIVRNHTPDHSTVVNYDDEVCRTIAEQAPGRLMYISLQELPAGLEGVCVAGDQVVAQDAQTRSVICARRELKVPGATANLLAMMAVGVLWKVPVAVIGGVAAGYAGREHVIEPVITAQAVDYYNDSKATNPWSTLHALDAFPGRPVVLITGGKDDKRAEVAPLVAGLAGRVRHVITMGQSGPRITAALYARGFTAVTQAAALAEAVALAAAVAHAGDVVLFSPGANSKDMFTDHRTRGELFKQHVRQLAAQPGGAQMSAR